MKKILNLIVMVCISICSGAYSLSKPKDTVAHITIWVHGTYPALHVLSSKWSPIRPWVYVPAGLSLPKDLPQNYYYHQLVYNCNERDPIEYNVDHFYTFGWHSSNVRPNNRKKVGKQLYQELNELLGAYKKKYRTIKVRMIGFSHGGNVILNCMSHLPFDYKGVELEAVLVATPIQESTRWYVNSPYVKRVFSLYSDKDWIQRIDMQRLHRDAPFQTPLLSARRFADSDRVIQVNFLYNGKALGHGQYRSMIHYIPDVLKQLETKIVGEEFNRHIGFNFITD